MFYQKAWGAFDLKTVVTGISQVTGTTDTHPDGSLCETVIMQAVQPVDLTHKETLNAAIYDVAFNADIIEETYFGGDLN